MVTVPVSSCVSDGVRGLRARLSLTVKTFVGTSESALRIQIWTALIFPPLLKWLPHLSKAGWSLSNLLWLPEFDTVAFGVADPAEFAEVVGIALGVDPDAFGG